MPQSSRARARRVPVVILAGFLGAGKTTLLNHLLAGARGTRIGVVVNDFGSVNVDALSVGGQVDSMVSLENGCLCCAVDPSGLDRMLGALTDPAAGLDLVVVEASGLAEPRSLVRLVLSSEDPYVEYGGLVELVDGAEFPDLRAHHPELDEQLAIADLVVLNKTDRAGDGVVDLVRTLAGAAPVVPAEFGRIDPELLFDRVAAEPDDGPRQLTFDDLRSAADAHGEHAHGEHEDEDHLGHAHAHYETVTVETGPLHPRRFASFLESRPAGLYRMKGTLRFGVPGAAETYDLHTVGAYVRLEPGGRVPGSPATRLVLIGAGVDADALRAEVIACTTDVAGAAAEQDLLPMLRYVTDRAEAARPEPEPEPSGCVSHPEAFEGLADPENPDAPTGPPAPEDEPFGPEEWDTDEFDPDEFDELEAALNSGQLNSEPLSSGPLSSEPGGESADPSEHRP